METAARERWRVALEAWALPQHLLDGVDESPYSWPADLFGRRRQPAEGEPSPTERMVIEIAGEGGSILDVGAGTGRLAIPLSQSGHRVVAVERDASMSARLAEEIAASGARITRVQGTWPDVAGNTGRHDVVLCAHVVYDVPAIGPFLDAMHGAARRGVVVELTPRHPWKGLSRYFRSLHGHELPKRPTVDDFEAVVREVTGAEPHLRWWTAPAALRFTDMAELLAFYRRRLLVPPERSIETAGLLEPDVEETDDGLLTLGPAERELVSMWWRV
jgi:2-polyprenyl-3-methyl-5-hydroxy-6-metoxy-1,4-benzoquinol methylase